MRFITLIVSFLAIATFAGCASKSVKEDVVYSGPAVRLRPAPGPGASAGQSQASALGFVNARREEVGLPAIAVDRGLEAAARDHARYLVLNRVGTHDEIEGRPGFTGADILTRVRLHTQAHSASEVLAMIGSSQTDSSPVEHIFASPYHRGALLFDWARSGEGSLAGSGSVTVMDFADIARTLANNELIAWPYGTQTRVPTAWMNNEQPDPMGPDSGYRGQVLGYPITLSGGPNAHIELQNVELRDARGAKVACRIAPLTAADAARNTAVCTPYEPLKFNTRLPCTHAARCGN
ncbi:hypothetical protein BVER_00479c [Candidatus Burkholderia verschuerenii]|uniref:SCP domain-containing protein n=1 Tax=Candidatus Burkholderia verschuerenii TaxID=242163 RepID=A0A0L0MBN1_9BURK|nr:CAP domain-containing protein [Candidatus Burkholderia verschuerenii]KND59681.1 hypothetical protein BVER_00479c [Candidatus Burkholderia verschuerenii]